MENMKTKMDFLKMLLNNEYKFKNKEKLNFTIEDLANEIYNQLFIDKDMLKEEDCSFKIYSTDDFENKLSINRLELNVLLYLSGIIHVPFRFFNMETEEVFKEIAFTGFNLNEDYVIYNIEKVDETSYFYISNNGAIYATSKLYEYVEKIIKESRNYKRSIICDRYSITYLKYMNLSTFRTLMQYQKWDLPQYDIANVIETYDDFFKTFERCRLLPEFHEDDLEGFDMLYIKQDDIIYIPRAISKVLENMVYEMKQAYDLDSNLELENFMESKIENRDEKVLFENYEEEFGLIEYEDESDNEIYYDEEVSEDDDVFIF